jgi:hypothetical protein
VNRRQKLIVVETTTGFALIMLYIWRLRFTAPRAWVFILGFFILSHILRGERTASLWASAGATSGNAWRLWRRRCCCWPCR